ncbi:hypothetical protein ACFY2K_30505 [Kitasatospora sp. NPDC001309]|uniref:hypothetical protein n=1 Tax=Kitasatospora sp. NPDC001309 TaxID=3364013 RepID=UPI003673BDA4
MTATNDALDPLVAAQQRWQHIEDQLHAIERQMREESAAALAAIDACLARLDDLHTALQRPEAWREADPGPTADSSTGRPPEVGHTRTPPGSLYSYGTWHLANHGHAPGAGTRQAARMQPIAPAAKARACKEGHQ